VFTDALTQHCAFKVD